MISDYFKPLVDWLYLHPHWGSIFTFLISFTESLAIIGAIIPGIVILTAVGVLVGSNVLPASEVIVSAALGAFLGDTLSFWVGYHYHEHVRVMWPFYRFPYLITKGEVFFQRHGGKSVFLGRFAGPVRVITPVVAGMLNMKPWKFVLTSSLASLPWAITYLLPGILIGAASQELPPDTAKRFLLWAVLLLLVFWCISWLLNRLFKWILHCFNRLILMMWKGLQSSTILRPIYNLLKYSDNPEDHTPLVILFSLVITVAAFALVTANVMHHGAITSLNQSTLHLMLSLRNEYVDKLFIGLTYIGEVKVLALVIVVVALWLTWKHYYRAAALWIINSMLAIWGISFLKPIVRSLRPQVLTINPSGWSFPSGHSTLSVAIFGFLAVLMAKGSHPNNRNLLYTFTGVFAVIIMSTRIYLNAHWLTDTIGGALLGLSCLLFTMLCYRPQLHVNPLPKRLFIVTFSALLLSWAYYFGKNYQYDLYGLTPRDQKTTLNLTINEWWDNRSVYPLLYRSNRFGKPVQIINVEWMGDLISIQQKMGEHGWIKKPKFNLALALTGLTANNRNLQPPLITHLYHNQKPSLVLTKYLAGENKQLVLRLWDSEIILSNSPNPLWVGTITYYRPWQPDFLNLKNKKNKIIPPPSLTAAHAFERDLQDFKWHETPFKNNILVDKKTDPDWSGFVLQVQP